MNIIYGTIGETAGNVINNGKFASNLSKFQVRYDGTGNWLECSESSNITNKSNCSFEIKLKDGETLTSMYDMFASCSSLTSLDLSSFDTSNVTNMRGMFYNCSSLTSLDLSSFDTSKVTDMYIIFYNCTSLTSLDLSSFNTSNVTSMRGMFNNCTSLTSLDLSSFNTSNVTNMNQMFYNCKLLTSLDLSNFNTSSVTDMAYMFANCSSLTSLVINNTTVNNILATNSGSNNTIFPTKSSDNPGNIIIYKNMPFEDRENLDVTTLNSKYWQIKETNLVASYKYDTRLYADLIPEFNAEFTDYEVFDFAKGLRRITTDGDTLPTLMRFGQKWVDTETDNANANRCNSLLRVFDYDASSLTTMHSTFRNCKKLVKFKSSTDNPNVTNMGSMFNNCSSLTSLDLSNFKTSKVNNMHQMFYNCTSLTSLDLSSFNTSNVTSMYDMFSYCRLLTSLDLSNFNTSSVTYMQNIFNGCSSFEELYLKYVNNQSTIYSILTNAPAGYEYNVYVSSDLLSYAESIKLENQNIYEYIEINLDIDTTRELLAYNILHNIVDNSISYNTIEEYLLYLIMKKQPKQVNYRNTKELLLNHILNGTQDSNIIFNTTEEGLLYAIMMNEKNYYYEADTSYEELLYALMDKGVVI